jgi:hypothetical protein
MVVLRVASDHVEDIQQDDDADRHAEKPKEDAAHDWNSVSFVGG